MIFLIKTLKTYLIRKREKNVSTFSSKNRLRFLRVRDLKGGEAGAKHGSEANPGKARRHWVGMWEENAGTPKKRSKVKGVYQNNCLK